VHRVASATQQVLASKTTLLRAVNNPIRNYWEWGFGLYWGIKKASIARFFIIYS